MSDLRGVVKIKNDGQAIVKTNYWESEVAERGLIFCSVNAGAIRVLLPPMFWSTLPDMRAGRECVLTRGSWAGVNQDGRLVSVLVAAEIMFDDDSSSPFAIYLGADSFDALPVAPMPGKEWVLSVWVQQDGAPHKAFERVCHWRKEPRLPCLLPWGE